MANLLIRDESATGATDGTLALACAEPVITLRELIRRRVQEECRRYRAAPEQPYRGLVAPGEVEQRLNSGRPSAPRPLDAEAQVQRAWRAFEHNGYFVLVGDRQLESLDDPIQLDAATDVVFVRLMPLVGG